MKVQADLSRCCFNFQKWKLKQLRISNGGEIVWKS